MVQFKSYLEKNLYHLNDPSSITIITDASLHALATPLKRQLQAELLTIPPGEQVKNLETTAKLWHQLHHLGVDKKGLLIGLGGGVVTDITGFVAATYLRGLPVIFVPTTVVAMTDAAIGGKNGVNLLGEKNRVGTIHLPQEVIIDLSLLKTLDKKTFTQGFSEAIKCGLIDDPALFALFESPNDLPAHIEEIVQRSILVKEKLVAQDRNDQGARRFLNFGHTFGHVIEKELAFSHAEAVSVGMMMALHFSHLLGWIERALVDQVAHVLKNFELPTKAPSIPLETWVQIMQRDKKGGGGHMAFILLQALGSAIFFQESDPRFSKNILFKSIESCSLTHVPHPGLGIK